MGRRRKFTDDELRKVLAHGMSRSEAARALGACEATVSLRAASLGLVIPARSKIDRKEFHRLADAGLYGREIAAQFGVTYQYVMGYARKEGVKLTRPYAQNHKKGADARSEDCKRRYLAGETLQQIGDAYGITRERVRQILTQNYGILSADGGMAAKAAERKRKRREARDAKCQKQNGCTYRQYLSIVREERRMKREGCPTYPLPRAAFRSQRNNAKLRGIAWELLLWEWWVIWQKSGKWSKRGRGIGGYCMCRKGDVGAYSPDNVYIATNTENLSDANKKSKLPLGVYLSRGKFVAMRRIGGKQYRLGRFDTPEEAHLAFVRFRGVEAAE